MRLIDADKLLKFFTVDTANQTYRFGTVKKQIESAPTVKAIPLEKVKQAKLEAEDIRELTKDGWKSPKELKEEFIKILDRLIESEEK